MLRTGLMLTNLLSSLLDEMSEDAFPGENTGEVLLEMLVGSLRPVLEAAGDASIEQATALLGAVADRTVSDLRAALALASGGSAEA